MAKLTRLVVVAVLLAVPVATRAQRPQPTFLGIVDKDGLLTPIAVYDGSAWWNRWPWAAETEEVRSLPVPSSLASIPADWLPPSLKFPTNWRAYTASGGKLVPFRALRPARRTEWDIMDTIVFVFTEVDQVTDGSGTRIVPAPPVGPMRAYGLAKLAGPIEGRTYYELSGEKMFRTRPGDDCLTWFSTKGLVVVGPRGNVVSEKLRSWADAEFCGDAPESDIDLATITIGARMWRIERTNMEDGYDYGLVDPLTGEPIVIRGEWGLREKRQMPNPNRVRHSAFAIRH
jgi:hypothetical protein